MPTHQRHLTTSERTLASPTERARMALGNYPPAAAVRTGHEREEFLARLDELISYARDNNFRGAAAATRALRRVRSLAALR
jgi:hypothetical protein